MAEEEMDVYGAYALGHGTLGRTGNHDAFMWTRSSDGVGTVRGKGGELGRGRETRELGVNSNKTT
jgi:hypothetical protein